MSNCSYLVTAQHATAVSHCDTGNFTSAEDLNLLIARGNRIEIMLVTPEGLRSVKEIEIYGTVEVMKLYKPYGSEQARLFVLTAKYNAMILEVEGKGSDIEILTKAYGDVRDKIGKKSETGILAAVDPEARVIGLRLYDSLFKVIPLDRGQTELKAFNIRIEEIMIHDIQFLHGCQHPTIALLHQDVHGRHVKAHELSVKENEFVKVAWKQDNVERRADMLIAVPEPFGGVLIIGAESITFHSGTNTHTIAPPPIQSSSIVAYSMVDGNGSRFLLGNMAGNMFMLVLEKEDKDRGTQVNMKLELLGETSIPETISYLDNGYVYIGSRLGDSQLIKLNADPDMNNSFVVVVDHFTNLGPIIDMIVVDLEKQGQGQLVTCSGGHKDGSLRVIRNGIGIHELATIDLPGIKGMWPLRVGSKMDNTLILTFVEQTRVLSLAGDEVEETEIPGFMAEQQTFYAGNTDFDQIIQVTPGGVRLVSSQSKELVDEWIPPGGKQISVCGSNAGQILVACGSVLFYLEVQLGKLSLRGESILEHEVACIDLTPIEDGETRAEVASVGLWTDISVRLLRIPSLEEITREMIGGEIIPRSILIAKFEGVNYLLCSLGDGSLFYFLLTPQGTLVDRRKVTLGTQPTVLRKFRTQSTTNVFVCSDRPTVIYSSNKKLVFANVNLKEVKHMCSLNTEEYMDCLALTSDTSITIGTIDEIQKLHIRTIQLGEAPLRIAYQEETSTFGVLTKRLDIMDRGGLKHSRDSVTTQAISTSVAVTVTGLNRSGAGVQVEYGDEVEVHSLCIVDQNTFEVVHAHTFLQNEFAMSIESCKLGDDPMVYYVVGTAIINPDESEPKMGRLVIFSWADGKLTQVAEKETKGSVWTTVSFNKKLMTTINNTVRLWEWTCEKELRLECSNFNHIMALYAKVSGDFILIGDLLKSMILLQYKPMEGSLDEIAKDYSPNWMTAVEIIDDEKFLGAESSSNLFVCQRDSGANTEEERMQMTEVGNIHLGEAVNVIRHGSLVMEHLGDSTVPHTGSMLVGTVLGSIKLITQIPQETFDLLKEVQTRLTKKIKSVGRIQHSFYRQFYNEKKEEHSEGFIDGDVIESFLDLDRLSMDDVCSGLTRKTGSERISLSTEDTMKIVEDLTRIH
jgi:DNA damage-binding protein 1